METLKDKNYIIESYSDTVFRFGNGKYIKFNRKIEIALTIVDTPKLLTADIIIFDIPFLWRKANTVIDFRNYYVRIFRKNVTSSGRSCISITSITSHLQLQGNCSNVLNPECLSNNDGE